MQKCPVQLRHHCPVAPIYATSRAYFKLQDLNSKELNINIFEGKIEKIESSSINISNLFINHEDKILNLRDLEVIIQQAERLQSQKLDIQLIPADIGLTLFGKL